MGRILKNAGRKITVSTNANITPIAPNIPILAIGLILAWTKDKSPAAVVRLAIIIA
jgi:hypothetical protein